MNSQLKSNYLYLYYNKNNLLYDLEDMDYTKVYLVDYLNNPSDSRVRIFPENQYSEFYTIMNDIMDELRLKTSEEKKSVIVAIRDIGPIKDHLDIFPSAIQKLSTLLTFCEFFNVRLLLFKDRLPLDGYLSKFHLIY